MPMRHGRRDERGLVLVFFSLTLIILLVFAAFAIDIGAVYNERRQDQSAADAGALGGIHEFPSGTPAEIAAVVQSLVHDTLGRTLTNWNSCGDTSSDPDDADIPIPGADCITYNDRATQLQVRIPVQQYQTSFANVVGIDTLDHTAFAIASLDSIGFGNVLPYGVAVNASDGGHICVRSGPGGIAIPPCTGPDSGNFGIIDLGIWLDNDCATNVGSVQRRQSETTAVGIDHLLSLYGHLPHNTSEVVDTPNCGLTPRPNAANVGPGNSHNETGAGLWSGDDFGPNADRPARLANTTPLLPGGGARATFTGGGNTYNLDDNAVWDFIPDSFPVGENQVPDSCRRSVFTTWVSGNHTGVPAPVRTYLETQHPDLTEQMRLLVERCMMHWRGLTWRGNGQRVDGTPSTNAADKPLAAPGDPAVGCGGVQCADPVFVRNSLVDNPIDLYDIQYTPRFGYVPQIVDPPGFPSGSSGTVRFEKFRPIFIQRVCLGSNTCGTEFDPGIPGLGDGESIGNGTSTSSFTAFLFPPGMLPAELETVDAPFHIGVNRFVSLVR